MTDMTGPKISSCAIRISLRTPVKIGGLKPRVPVPDDFNTMFEREVEASFALRNAGVEEAKDFLLGRGDPPPQPRVLFEPKRSRRKK